MASKVGQSSSPWPDAFDALHEYLAGVDFKGWEYDDLLASPLVNFLTRWGLYPRIAAVQVAKRAPLNLRPLLGVPKLHSTKAFGFMVKGYLHHHLATGEEKYLKTARFALDWLLTNTSSGYSGACWGNDFDFASRAGFFPKHLPTVVWSSHIQEAFDLAHRVLGDERYAQVVERVGRFVLNDLEMRRDETGHCIAYAPGIWSPVHNSNLLAAVALLRSWKLTGDELMFRAAAAAVNWSQARINEDGSWFYGDIPMLHWIDNYHTAYNLDCLCKAHELSDGRIGEPEIIERTYTFWKKNLFTPKGAPKFYYNRLHPLDIQATAQAIESFARYSLYDPDALANAEKVAHWAINHMRKENGAFRYRIHKHWNNNLEAIHWGQGTMLSALGYLIYHLQKTVPR